MARHRCHKCWLLWLTVILGSWIHLLNALEIVEEYVEEQEIIMQTTRQMALRLAAAPVRGQRSEIDGRPPSIPSWLDVRSPRPPRRHDENTMQRNIRWQHEQMQVLMSLHHSRMQARGWNPDQRTPARLPAHFGRSASGSQPVPNHRIGISTRPTPMAEEAEEPRVTIVRNRRPDNSSPGPRLPHKRRNAITLTGSTDSLDLTRLRLSYERRHRKGYYRWKHHGKHSPTRKAYIPPSRPTISDPMEFRPAPSPVPQRRTLNNRLNDLLRRHSAHENIRHKWHVRPKPDPVWIYNDDESEVTSIGERASLLTRTRSWIQSRMHRTYTWRLGSSGAGNEPLVRPLSTTEQPRNNNANQSRPHSPSESVQVNLETGEVVVTCHNTGANEQHVLTSNQLCSRNSMEVTDACNRETPRRALLGSSIALWLSGMWMRNYRKSS
ncbi:Rh31 [macacine betaherpesvirus 3]|uniref:Rh31 n=1 Tax=Rhesus cytomegalovirus (strain 68-1) TaxID=47929 RepID=Q2FAU0_RHCM6|nr:rh31 [macacine betaherpesvirus 3]APT39939.1 Rh31 [macacine betaherpesvirus 3]APT40114.1 Rh31 [macacine betaherpesvirus 3]APT40289.1 Rh31 [macacine betaherpesvirus 3]QQL11072.1 Rh31 [macacine betaherpesvirus 3]